MSSLLLPPTVFPPPNDDNDGDDDIYRGPLPPPPPSPRPDSVLSSSSSSSSLSGSGFGVARLGTIATVVEHAISRWARGGVSSYSSSLASSSQSSIVTLTRSQMARRRRRRLSMGNLHSDQSDRDIAARISLIKAREESRLVPRQFTLYLSPAYRIFVQADIPEGSQQARKLTLTSSLPFVLSQLDTALKKASKARRYQERARLTRIPDTASVYQNILLPQTTISTRPASLADLNGIRRKGKQRDLEPSVASIGIVNNPSPKTWFLDVASPTSADMHAIGKLLHLHPLTLEDILQQDPREKLELFPKLGYYFISFRAIESMGSREGCLHTRLHRNAEIGGSQPDEGILGEANVYIVVFNEGICIFHFTDISEHTDRVRSRLFMLEEVRSLSSAWIAHGLLDSIVDSFFPFLEEIEKEVVAIEELVFSLRPGARHDFNPSLVEQVNNPTPLSSVTVHGVDKEKEQLSEKPLQQEDLSLQTRFFLPRPPLPILFRRIKRLFRQRRKQTFTMDTSSSLSPTTSTLRRMAKARRLVTSLTRLLASKADVVLQIRKRLLSGHEKKTDDAEIAIYMGDIQDHILTLQHSLAHYERMLSQSHPIYLSQLRTSVSLTKPGMDKSLIVVTVVSIGVLCIQTLIGLCSVNVTIPGNGLTPEYPYYGFGIVISLAVVITTTYLLMVWRWWLQAKRRRAKY
ncbi:uncharacterized protein BT62DRAFT_927845 [Guyanagaster necrorhizus]|uniref:Uncharacterized protein n=1 Tax=Guyanagaster necrorhizus TaxID=856835 RepID=A0A9P8AWP4_9AGAR|nr:uncharacterized protein BT62DRAFT_927845 [Guyanagaster necrorhizus MCA 3950]KAG7450560.1 hypothetical protein BT62DRAFT_927845 [Guyanagaster necrorhizus MCA 3950]